MPTEELSTTETTTTATEPGETAAPVETSEPTQTETPAKEEGATAAAKTEAPVVKLPTSIKPPAKTGRFQERISDLVNQRELSRREAEQLREENARLKAAATNGNGKTAARPTNQPPALDPNDFDSYADYIAALTKQTIDQERATLQAQARQEQETKYQRERRETFHKHATPLVQHYGESFYDTITDPTLPISEAMADSVMELDELAPYTMLYLATHRDEAARIAQLNPRAASVQIGRIAAQIERELGTAPNAPAASTTSPNGAAASIGVGTGAKPVPIPRGSSPQLQDGPSDKDSVADWLKKETLRIRAKNPNALFYGAS
ncbi:MAG: hypothetical protein KGL39_34250 [Patescibacteria group bacterium]|nr:hypothetical protein [Patescibacteria group bacterium]